MNAANTQINAIANSFRLVLNEWLTPAELSEINRLNATKDYQDGSCATHNYCDPNQAMIDAFAAVIGREPEIGFDDNSNSVTLTKETEILNAAWAVARANQFKPL